MQFTVQDNIPAVLRHLSETERRILPLAHSKALTFTAEAVMNAEKAEMERVFDRPTNYALNSLRMKPATPASQLAEVFFKDTFGAGGSTPASNFLTPNIRGGTRAQKRSERSLANAGINRGLKFWVPGSGARLDKSGNITGATWTRMLSDLRATSDATQRRAAGKKSRWFIPKVGDKLREGIYERVGRRKIKPIAIFTDKVTYRPIFDFYGLAERTAAATFPEKWERSLERELRKLRNP